MTTTDAGTTPATEPDVEPDDMDGAPPPEREQQQLEQPVAVPTSLVRPQRDGSTQMIAGTDLAVVPQQNELAQLAQMAVTLSAADAVPRALQNRPNDVFLVLLTARDVGVALTTALREFHVIDGRVTLSPKVKLAMVRQQQLGDVFTHQPPRDVVQPDGTKTRQLCPCGSDGPANDENHATWHAVRRDLPNVLESSTFDRAMAERATKLLDKDNWKNYPQRMLSWRALGYLLDDVFGEVGTGLYSPDEMGAVTDEQGEPVIEVVGHADPLPGTRAPRGHNAPPPPEADAGARDGLRKRIDALPADGRTALVAMWTAGRETPAGPKLPPLGRLLERQVKTADALVSSIEARARKGEWGDWSPPTDDPPAGGAAGSPGDGPESPPTAPAAAEPTDGAQSTAGDSEPDPPSGDAEQPATAESDEPAGDGTLPLDAGDEPDEDADHAALIDRIIAEVAQMTDAAVRAELDVTGKSRNGTDTQVRRRLAMYRGKNAGVKVTEAQIKAATEGPA